VDSDARVVELGSGTFEVRSADIRLRLVTLGATVQALDYRGTSVLAESPMIPDRDGDSFAGAVIGRFANRIAGGRFTLDGVEHQLPLNDGPNCLHGGPDGLWNREWRASAAPGGVDFTLVSPDGDMGFPGELSVGASYRVSGSEVSLTLTATTTAPTPVNLTQHSYFNLSGHGRVLDHRLSVAADRVLEVDDTLIPLPGMADVARAGLDLRDPRRLSDLLGGRVDHCFVLSHELGLPAAVLEDPGSRRRLEVLTDAPGLQVYAGEHLAMPYAGVALEAQWLPNSPNRPDFPDSVLLPGQARTSTTRWRFSG
jgi:aldose 1-epimerase